MSYLNDKVPCRECGDLYDQDQLDLDNRCRSCVTDEIMLRELAEDHAKETE